jgi:hypothetical protein
MLNQSESTNTKPVYLAQSDRKRIFEQRLRDQLLAGLSGDLDDVALPLVFTRGDKIKAIRSSAAKRRKSRTMRSRRKSPASTSSSTPPPETSLTKSKARPTP